MSPDPLAQARDLLDDLHGWLRVLKPAIGWERDNWERATFRLRTPLGRLPAVLRELRAAPQLRDVHVAPGELPPDRALAVADGNLWRQRVRSAADALRTYALPAFTAALHLLISRQTRQRDFAATASRFHLTLDDFVEAVERLRSLLDQPAPVSTPPSPDPAPDTDPERPNTIVVWPGRPGRTAGQPGGEAGT